MAWCDALSPHERKVEDEMKFVVAISHVVNVVVFADEHSVSVVFVEYGAQFLHKVVYTRLTPLMLEHIVPDFFSLLFFLRCFSEFNCAAQLC